MLKYSEYEDRSVHLPAFISLGHTTARSCKIWARFPIAGTYHLIYRTTPFHFDSILFETTDLNAHFSEFERQHKLADHRGDNTVQFPLNDLQPDTQYYYALFRELGSNKFEWVKGHHKHFHFKTDPEKATEIRFALFSCHDPEEGKFHDQAWTHFQHFLENSPVHFLIGAGDQMYIDSKGSENHNFNQFIRKNREAILAKHPIGSDSLKEFLLDAYRCNYRHYLNYKALQTVQSRFPSYVIWDDHEIIDGWGSHSEKYLAKKLGVHGNAQKVKQANQLGDAMFRAATLAYSEYQGAKNPEEGNDVGDDGEVGQIHYTFDKGFVSFFVMDMRSHRDWRQVNPDNDDELKKWILGDVQHQDLQYWLEEKFNDDECEALFIVSPVPVYHWGEMVHIGHLIPSAKDDTKDEWDSKPNHFERDSFLNPIFDLSEEMRKPVIFLSGDVHSAAIFRLWRKDRPQANVFQMTCSGISRGAASFDTPISNKQINYSQYGSSKPPKDERVRAERLVFEEKNNFGFIRCEKIPGGVKINGQVITYSPKSEEIEMVPAQNLNPQ
ncbi:alkaline phosphatase family protein [bacterium SCSIO 12741]|nr:alkaline phosphatase family protein [bacterium SCSIO 12741]